MLEYFFEHLENAAIIMTQKLKKALTQFITISYTNFSRKSKNNPKIIHDKSRWNRNSVGSKNRFYFWIRVNDQLLLNNYIRYDERTLTILDIGASINIV